jgi:hypothetical protein
MTERTSQIVQFVHPGFEYQGRPYLARARSGVMRWKPGGARHDRKFMLATGALLDPGTGTQEDSVPMGFWGEWEGPSVFWRIEPPGKPLPSVVHAPFRQAHPPSESVQNTDPMVFGAAFIYSNCLQGTYRSLRTLADGSIVLFGRYSRTEGRPAFGLDCCFVVGRSQLLPAVPFDEQRYGSDLLEDAVLCPLHTEGARGDLTVYFGRGRTPDASRPFSFVPAWRALDEPPSFPRPELRPDGALADVISPRNMQGIKVTRHVSQGDLQEAWSEVVRQVAAQGCRLGHALSEPPVVDEGSALGASKGPPRALGG